MTIGVVCTALPSSSSCMSFFMHLEVQDIMGKIIKDKLADAAMEHWFVQRSRSTLGARSESELCPDSREFHLFILILHLEID